MLMLASVVALCAMHIRAIDAGFCFGSKPARTFSLGSIPQGRPELLWKNERNDCSVMCVSSGLNPQTSVSYSNTLCGYRCGTNSSAENPGHAALVSLNLTSGEPTFKSSILPSSDTAPLVVVAANRLQLVVTESAKALEMSAVSVTGASVGAPIHADLSGASPPATTKNGVVIWLMAKSNNGVLAGYLTNGVPHASMEVPTPLTFAAVGDSSGDYSGNSVFFAGSTTDGKCVALRVDVARTINSRFTKAWEQPISCPQIIPGNFAPIMIFKNTILLPGQASVGCGAQMLHMSNGSLVTCIDTEGGQVTALTAGFISSYIAVPEKNAIYRVKSYGHQVTRIDIAPILQGGAFVGPLVSGFDSQGNVHLIFMVQAIHQDSLSVTSTTCKDEDVSLHLDWSVSLPYEGSVSNTPKTMFQYDIFAAYTELQTSLYLVTVDGSVFALGRR